MKDFKPCVIDGSMKEGGGQILRTALSFSAILKLPILVNNIRAGRSSPGLKSQHLNGLWLMKDICKAKLEGDFDGSTQISFSPNEIGNGDYYADAKTAGSVSLLLQVSLPCLIFAKPNPPSNHSFNNNINHTTLTLKGGTNADMAPPIDFTSHILLPILKNFIPVFCNKINDKVAESDNIQSTFQDVRTPIQAPEMDQTSNHSFKIMDIKLELIKRGFFPKGGGEVRIYIDKMEIGSDKPLNPIILINRGSIHSIDGIVYLSEQLPIDMAKEMQSVAQTFMIKHFSHIPINIKIIHETPTTAYGPGSGIILIARSEYDCLISGSALGKRGVKARDVAMSACEKLLENLNHNGCVDEYTQDQLILFMAVAKGKSSIKTGPITLHTESVIYVIEKMLPDVNINKSLWHDFNNRMDT
ncbi:unnamed protein product [Gordionus sp. m RMFG-2023]